MVPSQPARHSKMGTRYAQTDFWRYATGCVRQPARLGVWGESIWDLKQQQGRWRVRMRVCGCLMFIFVSPSVFRAISGRFPPVIIFHIFHIFVLVFFSFLLFVKLWFAVSFWFNSGVLSNDKPWNFVVFSPSFSVLFSKPFFAQISRFLSLFWVPFESLKSPKRTQKQPARLHRTSRDSNRTPKTPTSIVPAGNTVVVWLEDSNRVWRGFKEGLSKVWQRFEQTHFGIPIRFAIKFFLKFKAKFKQSSHQTRLKFIQIDLRVRGEGPMQRPQRWLALCCVLKEAGLVRCRVRRQG